MSKELCSDCPHEGYQTDVTRCLPCPRRITPISANGVALYTSDGRQLALLNYRDTENEYFIGLERAREFAQFMTNATNSHAALQSSVQALQSQNEALLKRNEQLVAALEKAVEIIKVWHACDDVWDIYLNNAPEMKPLIAALAAANGAA